MHKLADEMMADVGLPLIHIADATAARIASAGLCAPGLMATAFTMEQDFYTSRLRRAGRAPVTPDAHDRAEIHRIIYDELCRNIIHEGSRAGFQAVAARLADRGARTA